MSDFANGIEPLKYRHIIWDWNGTLLNDAAVCRHVMNGMLARRNLPVMSALSYQKVFDFPVNRYYRRLGFDFTRETFEALGTEFISSYEKIKQRCRLQPGARALLKQLHQMSVRQFVLSAYRHETLVRLLQDKRIDHLFDDISGADDHYARGKTEQGRRLIERLELPRASTVLIGDTIHDYEVASAMGIDCMLIEGGHHHRERLTSCPCPAFANLHALRHALLRSN